MNALPPLKTKTRGDQGLNVEVKNTPFQNVDKANGADVAMQR